MGENSKPQERKKKFPVKAFAVGALSVLAVAGAGAGFYVYMGKQYETVFFPHTVINGFDVSNKTAEEVEELIASGVDGYRLTIHERGGNTEWITGEEIGLSSVFDGSLEKYLEAQDSMSWWKIQEAEYEISTMVTYDEEKLDKKISSLNCFSQRYATEPKDAYLSDYEPGQGFLIVPEEPGGLLEYEKAAEGITEAIKGLKTELELEELGAYVEPEKTSEDKGLQAMADTLNRYVNVEVTYQFGEQQEVLDGDTIAEWISQGSDGQPSISAEGVAAYVKGLASKYDTAYQAKVLKTSYGPVVAINGGFYGWRIDQAEEANQLYALIQSGQSQRREPVYSQEANSHGANDYGDTYVEINLTAQHLFFYKDGALVAESDFVSGSHAKGYDTPAGAYPLTYKQRDAVLRGENYRTPVKYWMPFNGNIGMHDASWRSSFGGKIYMTNGSHGCVNLPPSVAKTIFENISQGTPVLCYRLEGSDSKGGSSSKQGSSTTATTAPTAAPTAAQTAVPATAPQPAPTAAGNPAEESSPVESTAAWEPSSGEQPVGPGIPTAATAPTEPPVGPGMSTAPTEPPIGPGVPTAATAPTELPVGPGVPTVPAG